MFVFLFFFKQKTAYEMRISDWSSDVCSSDLVVPAEHDDEVAVLHHHVLVLESAHVIHRPPAAIINTIATFVDFCGGKQRILPRHEIGRASCRERVCQYV